MSGLNAAGRLVVEGRRGWAGSWLRGRPAAADGGRVQAWGGKYGAIIRLWRNAWEQFIPFLDYDLEIRTVLCSTNAIESLNARYRRRSKPAAISPPSRRP